MSQAVDQIKERLTIVDVVQPYVKLTRAGKYWKGLSPFTKEKTPSFFVTPDRGLYHCFSTGKGGDMFTFIEEMERVDFKGALKILADKAGVELTQESRESRDEREEMYAALEAASLYFESLLIEGSGAREYVLARGVLSKTIAEWRIGYAPKEWRALKDHLTHKGFSEGALLQAGLIKKPDSAEATHGTPDARTSYDRFRGRIMFPIFDASGRVIAFSGRIFEDESENPQAKYLNSPEGPLFDKSRALYGIQAAKSGIRELGFSMLVEGQFDLILAHQIGFRSAVATSGTAFTASHAEILKRYSENILLSYDGDKAGILATHRATTILLPLRMNVKVTALPDGADPADTIQKNSQVFRDAVKAAQPAVDFFIQELARTVPDERKRKIEVSRIVLPLIARIGNALDQSHFVQRVAESLNVPEDRVMEELKRVEKVPTAMDAATNADPFFADDALERLLYGILLSFEETGDARSKKVEEIIVKSFGAERLLTLRAQGGSTDEVARILASENFFLLHTTEAEQDNVIEELSKEVAFRNSSSRKEYDALRAKLHIAEKAGDRDEAERILMLLAALSKKLE